MPKISLERLSSFHISQKLQNAVLTFIGSQLCHDQDMQEIAELFRALDKNGDGKISKDELLQVYQAKDFSILCANPEKIMKEVDSNNSGFIDYTEFLIAMRKKELASSIENLEATFRCFDVDKNGKITATELRQVLGNGKGNMWQKLIQEVDLDGDGELDLYEFKTMMLQAIK